MVIKLLKIVRKDLVLFNTVIESRLESIVNETDKKYKIEYSILDEYRYKIQKKLASRPKSTYSLSFLYHEAHYFWHAINKYKESLREKIENTDYVEAVLTRHELVLGPKL